jgi:hypothetical protein
MSHGYENWDLFNAVMVAGWVAVTIPDILGDRQVMEDPVLHMNSARVFGKMRREILERFPDLFTRDAKDIALLTVTDIACFQNDRGVLFRNYVAMAKKIFRHPGRTSVLILKKIKDKIL